LSEAHPTHKSIAVIRTKASRRMPVRFRPLPVPSRKVPNSPRPAASVHEANIGRDAAPGSDSRAVVPLVLIATVNEAFPAPGTTEVGLMLHTESAGTPWQVRFTWFEKVPPIEPTDKEYVAVAPAFTVADPPEGDMLKSIPDPVKVTTCGLFAAESVNVTVPVRVPEAVAVNVT